MPGCAAVDSRLVKAPFRVDRQQGLLFGHRRAGRQGARMVLKLVDDNVVLELERVWLAESQARWDPPIVFPLEACLGLRPNRYRIDHVPSVAGEEEKPIPS